MLYFAYGSNMNRARMHSRVPGVIEKGIARLDGWTIVERLYADIEQETGGTVYGVLYELPKDGLQRLNRFEGCPEVYDMRIVTVEGNDGPVQAMAYVMTSRTVLLRDGKAYPKNYRLICSAGARSWALPDQFQRGLPQRWRMERLAVYGTLLKGERMESGCGEVLKRQPATIRGFLRDTGFGYPVFEPDGTVGQKVYAEVIDIYRDDLLNRFDPYEGFPKLYWRKRIVATLGNGDLTTCWVYISNLAIEDFPIIQSGDWRNR